MPFSDFRLRPAVLDFFTSNGFTPETVLDVGCGAGSNLDFYKPFWPESHWTALEVWPPYITQFSIPHRYDSHFVCDARSLASFKYDLVIFGDILEHMPKEESLALLDKAQSQAKFVLAALPVIHYPQGALEGNPYEEHVSEWTYEELAEHQGCIFSKRNDVTGSFIFKGI